MTQRLDSAQPLPGEYRKISTRIWNDEKFCSLPMVSQFIFIRVLTHQDLTSLGAFKKTDVILASEFQMKLAIFRRHFKMLLDLGLLKYDSKAGLVWAPHYMRYNAPNSPNAVKHLLRAREKLPECSLVKEILQAAQEAISDRSEPMRNTFKKTFPEFSIRRGVITNAVRNDVANDVVNAVRNDVTNDVGNAVPNAIKDGADNVVRYDVGSQQQQQYKQQQQQQKALPTPIDAARVTGQW